VRQLPHAQVIDDQERHGREIGEIRLAGPVERGVGELLKERVRFAIDDAIPLLDHRAPDGLGQMTLPRPWWAEKERVFPLRDEAAGRQLVELTAGRDSQDRAWLPRPAPASPLSLVALANNAIAFREGARASRKSSNFLGRTVGVVFMRVNAKCAHQVRPPLIRIQGIRDGTQLSRVDTTRQGKDSSGVTRSKSTVPLTHLR
jgi:hypothetical protein